MGGNVYNALSANGRAALADEREQLHSKLASLFEERDERQRALEETTAQIASCENAIVAISQLLGDEQTSAGVSRATVDESERPKATGDSIIEAVCAVFTENGNAPLHYRALTDLVLDRGVALGGKDAAGTLLSILTNARYSDRFERSARGTYRLASSSQTGDAGKEKKLRKSRRRRRVRRST